MGFQLSATFTSASADVTNYAVVPYTFGPSNFEQGNKDQILGFSAWGNSATGTAEIEVVIVDKTTSSVVWFERADVSATTRRTAYDNSSGSYLCSVVFATSLRNATDMLMCAAALPSGEYEVRVGCIALTNFTSLTVVAQGSGIP